MSEQEYVTMPKADLEALQARLAALNTANHRLLDELTRYRNMSPSVLEANERAAKAERQAEARDNAHRAWRAWLAKQLDKAQEAARRQFFRNNQLQAEKDRLLNWHDSWKQEMQLRHEAQKRAAELERQLADATTAARDHEMAAAEAGALVIGQDGQIEQLVQERDRLLKLVAVWQKQLTVRQYVESNGRDWRAGDAWEDYGREVIAYAARGWALAMPRASEVEGKEGKG